MRKYGSQPPHGRGRQRGEVGCVGLAHRCPLRRVELDVPDLRRDRHALAVVGSLLCKEGERFGGCPADAEVQQHARDDDARAPFARLAVDRDDARLVGGQPARGVDADQVEHVEARRVVVVKRVVPQAVRVAVAAEALARVDALGAEVVDAVARLRVVLLEEVLHLLEVVAVLPLEAGRREAHRDDARRDVAQVEVEAVLLKAPLLLGDDGADLRVHDAIRPRAASRPRQKLAGLADRHDGHF
eukprot:7387801-Prymnesium_polylepis.1